MINFYDSVYDKAMTQSLSDQEKKKAAASVLKIFHETVWPYSMKFIFWCKNIKTLPSRKEESMVNWSKPPQVFIAVIYCAHVNIKTLEDSCHSWECSVQQQVCNWPRYVWDVIHKHHHKVEADTKYRQSNITTTAHSRIVVVRLEFALCKVFLHRCIH